MQTLPIEAVDSPDAIARDIAAINRISAVPAILRVICDKTNMGYGVVARLTDRTWTACAVQDNIQFGLAAGGQLDLKTTLCYESRAAREPVVIDHFSESPHYCDHHTPRIYKLESYISVPIILSDGRYFGNLCAIDPSPRQLSDGRTVTMFEAYAQLIAVQLENEAERHEAEVALSDARHDSELREQFIAVLGHDLRNPLSSVLANAEWLERRGEKPEVIKLGKRLKATVGRMAALIDDVMDFARGRMGSGIGVDIRPNRDLDIALQHVASELREANPNVQIETDIRIPGTIHCDSVRVQQLASNLLGNAVSHGAHDMPIVFRAMLEEDDLVLSVTNGGDVIGPESLQKVFQPYWRPAESPRGGGLGLGLFICKQIADAHTGEMRVSSSSKDGTCFTARLPIHGAAVQATRSSTSH